MGSCVVAYARYVGIDVGEVVLVVAECVGVFAARVGTTVSVIEREVGVGAFEGVGVRESKARKLEVGVMVIEVDIEVGDGVVGLLAMVTVGFLTFVGAVVGFTVVDILLIVGTVGVSCVGILGVGV